MRTIAALLLFAAATIAAAGPPAKSDVVRIESALAAAPQSCSSAPPLSCGQSVTASPSCLSGEYYLDLYTFNGVAGQTITLTATTSTGYQMLVAVQNGTTGDVLKSNYGPSPVTLTYTVPSTASYYIGFGYVATFATGSYTLRMTCATAAEVARRASRRERFRSTARSPASSRHPTARAVSAGARTPPCTASAERRMCR